MTSEQIDIFLSFLRDCEQRYRMAEADEQEANNATQDILHSLELEEHDYRDFARLSKELREIRQKRRRARTYRPLLRQSLIGWKVTDRWSSLWRGY